VGRGKMYIRELAKEKIEKENGNFAAVWGSLLYQFLFCFFFGAIAIVGCWSC